MSVQQPNNPISWREWVSANAYIASGTDIATICTTLGIDQPTWESANAQWLAYLEEALKNDPLFGNEYGSCFSNPAVGKFAGFGSDSTSKGRTISSREEYMEIMGALALATARGEDMNTFLRKQYNVTPIEYTRAGMEWMSANAQACELDQDQNLGRILETDMRARSEAYRKAHTPTYGDYRRLKENIDRVVGTASMEWQKTYPDFDYRIKEHEYAFTDAYQQILQQELAKYDLDPTVYTHIQDYWAAWLEKENIKRFNEIFPTTDAFKSFYYEHWSLFTQPLREIEHAKYGDAETSESDFDTLNIQEEELYRRLESYIAGKGMDLQYWMWAEQYGRTNVLTQEERDALSIETFNPDV
jgi:hypothetical protein